MSLCPWQVVLPSIERAPRSPTHQWKCLASALVHNPPVGALGPRLAAQHTLCSCPQAPLQLTPAYRVQPIDSATSAASRSLTNSQDLRRAPSIPSSIWNAVAGQRVGGGQRVQPGQRIIDQVHRLVRARCPFLALATWQSGLTVRRPRQVLPACQPAGARGSRRGGGEPSWTARRQSGPREVLSPVAAARKLRHRQCERR